MRRIASFISKITGKKQNRVFLLFAILAVIAISFYPDTTYAVSTDDILKGIQTGISGLADVIVGSLVGLINGVLAGLIAILGWLISFSVSLLQLVASYDAFSSQPQVSNLWALVRDVMNSFFIVVLIVIAFATIIRWQPWQFKATLPKFIIAAIIINFSKTICLLAINFSTSIMRTFVTAIGESWPAFVLALRAPATVSFSSDTLGGIFGNFTKGGGLGSGDLAVSALTALVSSLFSLIILVIAFFAVMIFVCILLWRIIMLWMLTILSPAAFFLWAVPGRGAGYFKEWLDQFVKEVLIGPVVALMLYLDISFFISNVRMNANGELYGFPISTLLSDIPPAVLTLIGRPEILFGYIIGLAFIFVSVEIVMKIGARSVGLGTKTANALGKAGLYARDLARASALQEGGYLNRTPLGRVAPFIPWTPIDSTKGILQGLSNKRTKWNEDSRKAQLGYAANQLASDKPGRARAFLARLNAGDTELGENLVKEFSGAVGSAASTLPLEKLVGAGEFVAGKAADLTGTAASAAAGVLPGRVGAALQGAGQYIPSLDRSGSSSALKETLDQYRASTRDINSRLDTYNAHDSIRSGFDDNLRNKFGDYSLDEFNEQYSGVKRANEISELVDERDEIMSNFVNGVYNGDQARADAASARGNEILTQIADYEQSYSAQKRNEFESEMGDLGAYEKVAEMFDNQAAYQQGVELGDTFGSIQDKINDRDFKKEQTTARESDIKAFMSRRTAAADALSSVRANYQKQRLEYIKKEYPIEEEVDESTIFNRMLAHRNPEDKVKLSGDIVQAVKQGDGQSVLRKYGSLVGKDFSFTSDGMSNLVKHLQSEIELTKDEAMELVGDIQKIQYEEGRLAQGNFMERDNTGQRVIIPESKRSAAIQKNLTKKSLIKVLREGKLDAFGSENAQGVFSVHPGAVKGVKKQRRQLETILSNDRLAVQIPDRMLKMLEENAIEFGINDQIGRIQALRQ